MPSSSANRGWRGGGATTSGLSSKDSEHVIEIIRSMAHNKIVIVTIHQPSSKIFQMFQKVILLDKGGRLVFFGAPSDALRYFAEAEHPAEHLVARAEILIHGVGDTVPAHVVAVVAAHRFRRRLHPDRLQAGVCHAPQRAAAHDRREPNHRGRSGAANIPGHNPSAARSRPVARGHQHPRPP